MNSYKQFWCDQFDELLAQYEEEGLPEKEAMKKAEANIDAHARDKMADLADTLYDREKDRRMPEGGKP